MTLAQQELQFAVTNGTRLIEYAVKYTHSDLKVLALI